MIKYLVILLINCFVAISSYAAETNTYKILTASEITNLVSSASYVVNVKKYGANGDGVTDDSAAIFNAFTALTNSSKGGVLYFPAGSYLDTNTYYFKYIAGLLSNSLEPRFKIKGDGSGFTVWKSSSSSRDFIQFDGAPIFVEGISIEDISGLNNRRGVVATRDTGTQFISDLTLVNWDVGWDGAAGAGGRVFGLQAYRCGTGLRVSGYCDGWDVTMNARTCYRAGLEIGGTNHYPSLYASGGRYQVLGANNNIGVVIGQTFSAQVTAYLENSTNCAIAVGHPTEFGVTNEDWKIHNVILNVSGLQYSNQPSILLYAGVVNLKIDSNITPGQGRYHVESMKATADGSRVTMPGVGSSFKLSTGVIRTSLASTFVINADTLYAGNGKTYFQSLWTDETTSNAVKNIRLGQTSWNSDWYRPNVWLFGRINSANSATLNFGGGTSVGKPYSEIKMWLGDPENTGTGSNVFSILPSGLYGNGYGITNIFRHYATNATTIATISLEKPYQYVELSSNSGVSGFNDKWTGVAQEVTLLIKNTSASVISLTWPANTNARNMATNEATFKIGPGLIAKCDINHYPEISTNVLFFIP